MGGVELNSLVDQTRQLYSALKERVDATSLGFNLEEVPEDSLQKIPWSNWHFAINVIVRGYLDTTVHPDGSVAGRFAGPAFPGKTWALNTICNEALGQSHFTKKRYWKENDFLVPEGTHALADAPGVVIVKKEGNVWVEAPERGHADIKEETGLAGPGDIIGPWLWNELRAVINLLTHTYIFDTFFKDPAILNFTNQSLGVFESSEIDYADALDKALAATPVATLEQTYRAGTAFVDGFFPNPNNYYVFWDMCDLRLEVAVLLPNTGFTAKCHCLLSKPQGYPGASRNQVFDPVYAGFPNVDVSEYFLVDTVVSDGASSVIFKISSNLNKPVASDFIDPSPPDGENITRGVRVSANSGFSAVPIFEWDFEYA